MKTSLESCDSTAPTRYNEQDAEGECVVGSGFVVDADGEEVRRTSLACEKTPKVHAAAADLLSGAAGLSEKNYRSIIEVLEASDCLRARPGLRRLPHYSTLRKFADRSDVLHIVDCMISEIVRQFAPDAEEAAVDSTGLEITSAIAHYRSRSGKARKKYI